jgi:hypothetical protein
MKAALAIALVASISGAAADPLPPGSLGMFIGPTSGTGADAKVIGGGLTFGAQAAWQPMNTDRHFGWAVRWATMFGLLYSGSAAQIEPTLRTVQIDFTAGIRYRPWASPSSYFTLRPGVELLRLNEPLPPAMHRSFVGGIVEVGFERYVFAHSFLVDVDLRYGLLGSEPANVALLFGFAVTGP